jgi:hypothetical protein
MNVPDVLAAVATLVDGRAHRDIAPASEQFPYITVDDEGATPGVRGDGVSLAWRSLGTLHLWEREEALTLAADVITALDGLRMSDRKHLSVDGWVRVPAAPGDPLGVVHRAVTLRAATSA